jgi:hypothetical protein
VNAKETASASRSKWQLEGNAKRYQRADGEISRLRGTFARLLA